MSKIHKKTCLILRINDYKDNKSIIKALSKNEGLINFSASGFKKYSSRLHGKIQKLTLIDGIFYESSNTHLKLSSIESHSAITPITCLQEFQSQQKLCFIAEKINDSLTSNLIIEILEQAKQLEIHKTLHIYLIKILQEQTLIEIDSKIHKANYFYLDSNGVINNNQGIQKISLNTIKTIQYIKNNPIKNCLKLVINTQIQNEIEDYFKNILEIKLNVLIDFRNFNNVFDTI